MDNVQMAKEELAAIKAFSPDAIEEIAERYFIKVKAAYAIWKSVRA